MHHIQQMIEAHPKTAVIGGDVLVHCINASLDCAQSCTSCADACLGEEQPEMLRRCIRLNLDCADICSSTGAILSRQTAFEPTLVQVVLNACAEACRICAEECEKHAKHGMEHCRVCAESCRTCAQACNDMMTQVATA